ncbi:MAG TPA: DUF1707 domain-containing protein [Streptosporangiaceae bacterium]|nr:DUF1707 domain-containing protein [Streptosporangiaceae bacterium]
MAAGSGIRIGDAERNAMAESLREHYAAGRLTMEEFQERLDAAFAAKTDADLAKLAEDLPHSASGPYAAPWPPAQNSPVQPYVSAGGRQARQGAGARVFAVISTAMSLLVLATLLILWLPFGGLPKTLLIILAVFAFLRRILRRVITGGGRRGW